MGLSLSFVLPPTGPDLLPFYFSNIKCPFFEDKPFYFSWDVCLSPLPTFCCTYKNYGDCTCYFLPILPFKVDYT